MTKFDKLFHTIMESVTPIEEKEKLVFDTYKEARDFLNKNYNGHGPIYDINGELIETCRCMQRVHDQMKIPYVQCKQTVEEHEAEVENSLKNIKIV